MNLKPFLVKGAFRCNREKTVTSACQNVSLAEKGYFFKEKGMAEDSKNYREKFEKHYGIEIPQGFEVHHIDLNHDNNDVKNLMILPKWLHRQYHKAVSMLDQNIMEGLKKAERAINVSVCNSNILEYRKLCLEQLFSTLSLCSRWVDYKHYLDGTMPNIHHIELERKNG